METHGWGDWVLRVDDVSPHQWGGNGGGGGREKGQQRMHRWPQRKDWTGNGGLRGRTSICVAREEADGTWWILATTVPTILPPMLQPSSVEQEPQLTCHMMTRVMLSLSEETRTTARKTDRTTSTQHCILAQWPQPPTHSHRHTALHTRTVDSNLERYLWNLSRRSRHAHPG